MSVTSSHWDRGSYEVTAEQIAPLSPVVADAVEPVVDQPALDLACGTGNEALILARRGARVTGFDGAPRLLSVAEERASAEGLEAQWVQGDLTELPFADDSFEIVTSVMGLIFSPDPARSASEIGRILRPQGRLAFTSWVEDGLFKTMQDMSRNAVAEHFGQATPEGADAPFAWGDEVAIQELFSEHGLMVQVEERELMIEEDSANGLNNRWFDLHPIWLTMKEAIGEDRYEALRIETLPIVEQYNEATDGSFRYTLKYLLSEGSPV